MPKDCCNSGKKEKSCRRRKDGKVFNLPRKFSKKKCMEGVKGFTMRSSCAPYNGCKKDRSTRRKSKKRKSKAKRSTRRKSKKRTNKRSTKKRRTKKRKSVRRKTKKKGYSSYTKKESSCTKDENDIFNATNYELNWDKDKINDEWKKQTTTEYSLTNNKLAELPDSLTINGKTYTKGDEIHRRDESVSNRVQVYLYTCKENSDKIILKLQLKSIDSPHANSDGSCGLIKSKTIASLEIKRKKVYIDLMQYFTGDLTNSNITKEDINIAQLYKRLKNMLICLRDEKELYYADLKMENILYCQDEEFSFYLGDIESAVKIGDRIRTTYPPPELIFSDSVFTFGEDLKIKTKEEGDRYLSWQLGITMLQICLQKYQILHPYLKDMMIYFHYNKMTEKSVSLFNLIEQYLIHIIKVSIIKDINIINIINIVYQTLIDKKPIGDLPDQLPISIPNRLDAKLSAERRQKLTDELESLRNEKLLEKIIEEFPDEFLTIPEDKELLEKLLRTPGISTRSKRKFLFNPNDPKKSFDVYIDKNPKDTIPIKYRTYTDTKNTVRKLESLYKKGKYPHKRIFQVAMILRVRLKVLKKDKKRAYELACRYYDFIKSRTKIKGEKARKKLSFKY